MIELNLTPLEIQRRQLIAEQEATIAVEEAQFEKQLPRPVGYKLLIAMPEIKKTHGDTAIVKSEITIKHDLILSMTGLVLDMGSQAYSDKERFPTGPWCKVGDYVLFRANSGTRFMVGGKEYRLINDDTVEGTVDDPSAVQRVN